MTRQATAPKVAKMGPTRNNAPLLQVVGWPVAQVGPLPWLQ